MQKTTTTSADTPTVWIVQGAVSDPSVWHDVGRDAVEGQTEWQVSDGPSGNRGCSTDFLTLDEALAYASGSRIIFEPDETPPKPRYSHAFTFAFEADSHREDAADLSGAELRDRLLERLNRLSDSEVVDTCGDPFGTCEID